MHKLQSSNTIPPFKPIVSSVNTYNYQIAKYPCILLQPHLPGTYTISDSFSFVQELKTIGTSNKFMAPFNVVSLFTNIPLKESIELAVSYTLEGTRTLHSLKLILLSFFQFILLIFTFFLMVRCMIK